MSSRRSSRRWLTSLPKDPENWVFEIKFDGYRMLARVQRGRVRLVTRNGNDWTRKLPQLVQSLQAMELPDGWYDGEIIMPGERVPADFQACRALSIPHARPTSSTTCSTCPTAPDTTCATCRWWSGARCCNALSSASRRTRCASARSSTRRCRNWWHRPAGSGSKASSASEATRPMSHGASSDWIKLKCGQRQEFVIGGYTDPKGSRTGIGSLLLGVHDRTARCGTPETWAPVSTNRPCVHCVASWTRWRSGTAAFARDTDLPRNAHWVRPELVCEVAFGEWTRDGRIRHSVFHGLRSDKPAQSIMREEARHTAPVDQPAKVPRAARTAPAKQHAQHAPPQPPRRPVPPRQSRCRPACA